MWYSFSNHVCVKAFTLNAIVVKLLLNTSRVSVENSSRNQIAQIQIPQLFQIHSTLSRRIHPISQAEGKYTDCFPALFSTILRLHTLATTDCDSLRILAHKYRTEIFKAHTDEAEAAISKFCRIDFESKVMASSSIIAEFHFTQM